MDNVIEIVPYDEAWPAAFEAEAARIEAAVEEYENLKRSLAPKYDTLSKESRQAYVDAKGEFIERIIKQSLTMGYPTCL